MHIEEPENEEKEQELEIIKENENLKGIKLINIFALNEFDVYYLY